MEKVAIWSDMPLFNSFRILLGILFGPSLLTRFKEEIVLEIEKNYPVFKGGR